MAKKTYKRPSVQVAQFESNGIMQVSGEAGSAPTISIKPGSSNQQW